MYSKNICICRHCVELILINFLCNLNIIAIVSRLVLLEFDFSKFPTVKIRNFLFILITGLKSSSSFEWSTIPLIVYFWRQKYGFGVRLLLLLWRRRVVYCCSCCCVEESVNLAGQLCLLIEQHLETHLATQFTRVKCAAKSEI